MDFDTQYLGNSVATWLQALVALVVVLVALRLARGWIASRLAAWATRTATTIDDLIAALIAQTKLLFLLAVSVFFASKLLELPAEVVIAINRGTILVVLLQAAIWGSALVTYLIEQYVRLESPRGELEASAAALGFLGKLGVWTLIFILALENLNFDITALVTSLGIGGIAIALAVQNILGDLFASLSILLDKPFVVGDFIVVDNFQCTVEHIGMKTTRARSVTGEQVVFANSDLLKSRLRNFKRMRERRTTIQLGIVYQTSPQVLATIPAILKEIVQAQPNARFDRAHFKEFGPSSLNFEMVYWVTQPDYATFMDTLQAVNLSVFQRFEREGIEFAYPTQSLFVTRQTGDERAGGRAPQAPPSQSESQDSG